MSHDIAKITTLIRSVPLAQELTGSPVDQAFVALKNGGDVNEYNLRLLSDALKSAQTPIHAPQVDPVEEAWNALTNGDCSVMEYNIAMFALLRQEQE